MKIYIVDTLCVDMKGIKLSVSYIEVSGNLEIDYKVRDYCTLPYPGHLKGCPFFGKRKECPPQAPLVKDFIDLEKPHYFAMAEYTYERKQPEIGTAPEDDWLYWHRYAESVLCKTLKTFQKDHPGAVFTLHPSAVGVDVFKTAQNVGIFLESAPKSMQ